MALGGLILNNDIRFIDRIYYFALILFFFIYFFVYVRKITLIKVASISAPMLVSLHDEKFTRFKLLELRMSRQITVERKNKTYLGFHIKKNDKNVPVDCVRRIKCVGIRIHGV
jgi:hypothetical protein